MAQVRTASPARWQAALQRAVAQGVTVYRTAFSDFALVTSGTDRNTVYRTDGVTCACDATKAGDPVCKHRAAYWFDLGTLDVVSGKVAA